MKIPTWVYIVGITMILFGGCGIIKEQQNIFITDILEKQQSIFSEINTKTKDIISESDDSDSDSDIVMSEQREMEESFKKIWGNASESIEGMFTISEFSKTWIVRFGILGAIISLIYLFAGIFLLIKKSFSLPLAYTALILSIVLSLVRTFVLASDTSAGNLIGFAFGATSMFGIIFDVILIVVILASDKTFYQEEQPTPNKYE